MKALLNLIIRNGRGETIAELALEPISQTPDPGERRPADFIVTEAQRRLLFRLAARLGFEGDRARDYVDRRLGPDPDKRAASRLIDELQDEVKRSNGGRDERAS
jgi:hypothetical protein